LKHPGGRKVGFIGVVGWMSVLGLTLFGGLAWADSAEVNHAVAVVVVQPGISITEETGDFTLTFDNYTAGTQSDTRQVQYRIKGNSFPTSALDGVVSAKLSQTIDGVELQADVGSYDNLGSEGNIQLEETQSGFHAVGTALTSLADKRVTTGSQARVLNGRLPIDWRAQAIEDLSAGNYTTTLTVTVKDG